MFHSNNALHADSNHTNRIKSNFLFNEFIRIKTRCSNAKTKNDCYQVAFNKFINLNYTHKQIKQAMRKADFGSQNNKPKTKPFDANKPVLKLPFVSNSSSRKIERCIADLKLDFNIIFRPEITLPKQ